MSNLAEVECAIREFETHGTSQIAILQCVSAYPAEIKDQNLRAMAKMSDYFDKIVGFSDHTNSQLAALVAIGLGMKIWEKHLTIDKKLAGPDHKASTEPQDFSIFVEDIRKAESPSLKRDQEVSAIRNQNKNSCQKINSLYKYSSRRTCY